MEEWADQAYQVCSPPIPTHRLLLVLLDALALVVANAEVVQCNAVVGLRRLAVPGRIGGEGGQGAIDQIGAMFHGKTERAKQKQERQQDRRKQGVVALSHNNPPLEGLFFVLAQANAKVVADCQVDLRHHHPGLPRMVITRGGPRLILLRSLINNASQLISQSQPFMSGKRVAIPITDRLKIG